VNESELKKKLAFYAGKMISAGLVAGAGGNISARLGDIALLSPSGYALDEIKPRHWVKVQISTGKILTRSPKPTSEVAMHIHCYRARPDAGAIVHTHSPFASGIISAGENIKPMFAEMVCDVGPFAHLDFILPTTEKLGRAVARLIRKNNLVLMRNHGVIAIGQNLKQAYYRCLIIEEAAKSIVAACTVGKPRFFTRKEIRDIENLPAIAHRRNVAGDKGK